MDLNSIREFCILADYLNFSVAATKLGITKDTLSRHIATLEKELNLVLFVRTTRSVSLTQAGIAFLPYAHSITETMHDFVQFRDKALEHRLTIGSIHSMQALGITDTIRQFSFDHPDINVHLMEKNSGYLIEYLNQHECDCAFIMLQRDNAIALSSSYIVEKLIRNHSMVLLPKNHPLAGRKYLTVQNIESERLVQAPVYLLNKMKEKKQLFSAVIDNTGMWVSSGMGIAVLVDEEAYAQAANNPEIVLVPLEDSDTPSLYFVYPPEGRSDYCTTFIRYVAQNVGLTLRES